MLYFCVNNLLYFCLVENQFQVVTLQQPASGTDAVTQGIINSLILFVPIHYLIVEDFVWPAQFHFVFCSKGKNT